MKTKISVDIHKSAHSFLMLIADFVGQHNEGKLNLTVEFLESYLMVKKHESKYVWEDAAIRVIDANTVQVSNDKEFTPFATITWKEVTELNTITEMD